VGATGTISRSASVTASWKILALPPPASTTIAPNSARLAWMYSAMSSNGYRSTTRFFGISKPSAWATLNQS